MAEKTVKKRIAKNPIKEFMKKVEITQEQLAQEIGVSRMILSGDINNERNILRMEFGLWKLLHPSALINLAEMLRVEFRPREGCLVCRDYSNNKINVRVAKHDKRFKKGHHILAVPVEIGSAYQIVGDYTNKGKLIWKRVLTGEVEKKMNTSDILKTDLQRDK